VTKLKVISSVALSKTVTAENMFHVIPTRPLKRSILTKQSRISYDSQEPKHNFEYLLLLSDKHNYTDPVH
jgi:hypothetical protein